MKVPETTREGGAVMGTRRLWSPSSHPLGYAASIQTARPSEEGFSCIMGDELHGAILILQPDPPRHPDSLLQLRMCNGSRKEFCGGNRLLPDLKLGLPHPVSSTLSTCCSCPVYMQCHEQEEPVLRRVYLCQNI